MRGSVTCSHLPSPLSSAVVRSGLVLYGCWAVAADGARSRLHTTVSGDERTRLKGKAPMLAAQKQMRTVYSKHPSSFRLGCDSRVVYPLEIHDLRSLTDDGSASRTHIQFEAADMSICQLPSSQGCNVVRSIKADPLIPQMTFC